MPTIDRHLEYRNVVEILLDESLSLEEIKPYIRKLHAQFSEAAGVTGGEKGPGNEQFTQKNERAGISVRHAAKCLWPREDIRTLAFLRSAVKNINRLLNEGRSAVEVLYAGCGPYATFLSLIAPLYLPGQLKFTLIEINPVAFSAAERLIKRLGLRPYVRELQLADAIKYQVKPGVQFDLLISETMNMGLREEPLVPILLNLLPQLPADVVVLPENAFLDVVLAKAADLPGRSAAALRSSSQEFPVWQRRVFELKAALHSHPDGRFSPIRIELPDLHDYDYVAIYTEVQVHDQYLVRKAESDFSEPIIRELTEVEKGKSRLEAAYQLKPIPELKLIFT